MGRKLKEETRLAIEAAVADPNIHVHSDGSVWRRIGKPDVQGKVIFQYRFPVTKNRQANNSRDGYVGIPVQYLIWRTFKGSMPPSDRFIIFKDRNAMNMAIDNLALDGEVEYPERFRRTADLLSFDEALAIKKDYADGLHIRKIMAKYSVSSTTIEGILELPSTRKRRKKYDTN